MWVVGATHYGRIPEWPKGTDCKSAGDAFEGSNPSPSTTTPEHIRSGILLSYAKAVRIFLHPLYSKLPGIFAWEFFIPLLCISSAAPWYQTFFFRLEYSAARRGLWTGGHCEDSRDFPYTRRRWSTVWGHHVAEFAPPPANKRIWKIPEPQLWPSAHRFLLAASLNLPQI